MKLSDVLRGTGITKIENDALVIPSITADSRKVGPGSLFVALPGPKTHGAKFIADALQRGAGVIVYGKDSAPELIPGGVVFLEADDAQGFLATALGNFYNNPSAKVRLVGITGTNGKTTITYLLENLFSAAGKSCGVVGTINHRYGGKVFKAGNTTPGLVENVQLLAEMADHTVDYCAMEVSSHALDQRRVEGLDFRYALFTNLTSDHLDYHKDRETYFLAKAKLFTHLEKERRAIINIDDEFGPRLKQMSLAPVWTYGLKGQADFCARKVDLGFMGSSFDLVTPLGCIDIKTPLIGPHNIYNILSVAAVGCGEGFPLPVIKKGIESSKLVPGRLERIEAGQDFHVFVDYAHTEDALINVLSSLRTVKKARILVVFGCGGDRDRTKRPRMAAAVEAWADYAIVTTDNPRSEDPEKIIEEVLTGFTKKNFKVVVDRQEAIMEALRLAQTGDVVLIAGKGHEDYQIFKDKTIPFDERKIVAESLLKIK